MSEQLANKSGNKPELLIVDDSKVIRLAARKMLGDDYVIHLANDGLAGWELLQLNNKISVVFTDLIMPNVDGMQLLENIRNSSNEHIANLPVIIMTGYDDSDAGKQRVFDAGATDFISKPFESIDLVSRAKSYARLSRKVIELEKKTGYDKLTGLYNTSLMQEQAAKACAFAERHKLFISIVYFEIRGFQELFLSHGKSVAQQIIVAVGKRLHDVMREEDIAARIAVAKYSLVLPMTNRKKTEVVINRVRENINKLVFDTGKEKIRVNFVAGYSSPGISDGIEFKEMLAQADDALQRATNSSVAHVVCFDDDIEAIDSSADVIEEVVEEPDFTDALEHILSGDYYKIPEKHIVAVMDRLRPFVQYVENLTEHKPTEQGFTEHDVAKHEKNIAI
jgi:diguanylate cyclase (GGDEF)-like protein